MIVLGSFLSCKKNEPLNKAVKIQDVLTQNSAEETEASFFIAASDLTKSIIVNSQRAQREVTKGSVREFSFSLVNNQNLLLQAINKEAFNQLIIITDFNIVVNNDQFTSFDEGKADFDQYYMSSVIALLSKQIELFESVSKATQNTSILKLILYYLPKQYQLLREAKKIKTNL